MATDYGKEMFDTYFDQGITILTILLVSGKGKFFEFFDDVIVFLSILTPTIIRLIMTKHINYASLLIVFGVAMIYVIFFKFHYSKIKYNNKIKEINEINDGDKDQRIIKLSKRLFEKFKTFS